MKGRPTNLELDVEDTDFAKAFEELMRPIPKEPPMKYIYKNWKGEIEVRTIYPLNVSYGSSEHHPTPTYLMRAWDLDKKAISYFDMSQLFPYKSENELAQHKLQGVDHHKHNTYYITSGCDTIDTRDYKL